MEIGQENDAAIHAELAKASHKQAQVQMLELVVTFIISSGLQWPQVSGTKIYNHKTYVVLCERHLDGLLLLFGYFMIHIL